MGALHVSYNPWYLTGSRTSEHNKSSRQHLKTTVSIKQRLLVYSLWIDVEGFRQLASAGNHTLSFLSSLFSSFHNHEWR